MWKCDRPCLVDQEVVVVVVVVGEYRNRERYNQFKPSNQEQQSSSNDEKLLDNSKVI